ncbi:MAG: diguanylate cyclase [Synechococcus sp.]
MEGEIVPAALWQEEEDDELVFLDEDTGLTALEAGDLSPWKVLVVDDEEQVHSVTQLALKNFEFEGRSVELISAYSEAEAKEILANTSDIAVLLLDVVMETDLSGLEVVKYVRETLHNQFLRIVLRTGQPGIAPETSVIEAYDINDYRNKTELTQQKLFSITITSLRSYRGILQVEESRQQVDALNRQLQHINQNLEALVQERTQELATKNQLLLQEIVSRKRAQAELEKSNVELDRVNSRLEFLATHDELTELANRRYFNDFLEQTWQLSRREQAHMVVILCDIDYFKQYNDTYGHLQGDLCLKQVSAVLKEALKRPSDLAARFGGEEFALVLFNTDLEGAEAVVQAVQAEVEGLGIAHVNSQVRDRVTLSFGISGMVPQNEVGVGMLVAEADKALYQAKAAGRDRMMTSNISAMSPEG